MGVGVLAARHIGMSRVGGQGRHGLDDLRVGEDGMVALIVEQHDGGHRPPGMAGRDDEPVDEGTRLVGTEPHPHLTPKAESGQRAALLLQLQIDVGGGGHLSVHLALEDVEYLLAAPGPVAQVPDLLSVHKAQGVLECVGAHLAFIVVHCRSAGGEADATDDDH